MLDSSAYRVDQIEHALLRQGWMAEGRFNAFAFAAKCRADVSCIQAELESEEVRIQEMLASISFGSNNPMAPGASPRIYRDAYISGLREALALIQEMSGSEPDVEGPA